MTKDEAKAAVERMRPLFENGQKKEAGCDCETCAPHMHQWRSELNQVGVPREVCNCGALRSGAFASHAGLAAPPEE